jgi:uncharacterized membrane protein
MMRRDQIHLAVNLLFTMLVVLLVFVLIWNTTWLVWVKHGLTLIALILAMFFVHRLAPRLTGKWVDRLYDQIPGKKE